MKMNTESSVYTIVYAMILVVIVAVLLAVVNQGLKSRQEANARLDQQKQMLVALNQDYSNSDPAVLYQKLVVDTLLSEGERANIIMFEVENQTKYVLRLHGQGLWGGIGGYMALNDDKNTVFGINFNHEGETPGLGGEIVTEKFRSQFFGKHIKDVQGNLRSIAVLKEGKMADEGQEQVDAWAGATITSTGVSEMLASNLQEYSEFLNDGHKECYKSPICEKKKQDCCQTKAGTECCKAEKACHQCKCENCDDCKDCCAGGCEQCCNNGCKDCKCCDKGKKCCDNKNNDKE